MTSTHSIPLTAPVEGHDHVHVLLEPTLKNLYRFLRIHLFFHVAFLCLTLGEMVCFFVFFPTLLANSLLAFGIGVIFLTLFSYVLLRIYFQTKKWTQMHEIRKDFIIRSKQWLQYDDRSPDHQIALANLCTKFAIQIERGEYSFFDPPSWLSAFHSTLQRFGAWWFGLDFHSFREMFLQTAVEEHIAVVKRQPTNLEAHANLANAYVTLSTLYALPEDPDDETWLPSDAIQTEWEQKFRVTAEKAVEELKILNDYAPNDPWVHAQLAYSYHDLKMPLEEIREYEMIFRLRPEDKQTLFRLGILYFEQGFNAKGLRVYEELRRSDPKKAESLIKYYGACETTGF